MIKYYILVLFSSVIVLYSCHISKPMEQPLSNKDMVYQKPPSSHIDNITDDYFGVKVADPYRWLEDENSEETKEWVDNQIEYASNFLDKIPYRDKIRMRLTQLINYEKFGNPIIKKGITYIFKNDGLQNQSVLYELDQTGKESRILIDPNKFSKDGTVSLSGMSFNKSGQYLAYMVAASGADWNTCYVIETKTGNKLQDSIKWIKFSGISWFGDGFFYSRYPDSQGGKVSSENMNHKLYYHKLGTSQKEDVLWFEDTDNPKRNVYAVTSEDQRYLILTQTESTTGNSFNFIDLASGNRKLISVVHSFDSDYNFIDNSENLLYVLTTKDAPNKKLIAIDADNPEQSVWKSIIPESNEPIESVEILDGRIFVTYLKNAYSQVKIFDLSGKFLQDLTLPVIGTISGFSGEKNSEFAYFSISSFLFPSTVYKLNLKTLGYEAFKSSKLDFDPEKYITVQKWFSSKDGTKVPMFLTYKKDIKLDGNNPALLYGYGGFSISVTPSFSASRLLFLEKGGIYAVANIRGGGEFGEEWHKAGTLERKQNVFDDFIAAAEYLVKHQYTNPAKLAIEGGSNGGLLVGACMLQRPDLFGVAFPRVGVLDMLRYHKFTIGWAWATDYGKSDDEEAFRYLIKYSPVHNVKKGVFPATLVMTADHDDRVVPAHSFKFISELQSNQTGDKPVMIRIDKKAGHGAGKPLTKVIDEMTDLYSFMFYNMGINY